MDWIQGSSAKGEETSHTSSQPNRRTVARHHPPVITENVALPCASPRGVMLAAPVRLREDAVVEAGAGGDGGPVDDDDVAGEGHDCLLLEMWF